MSTIKRLTRKDMFPFAVIGANAYVGMKVTSEEDIRKLGDRLWKMERIDPEINLYGLFRKGKLVGGMRMFDFTMRMFSTDILVGGLGFVAVDLLHKREHVCKELVEFYINHYAKKKSPMLALYPFRPDFYRKMGFGYGAKINQYRFKPGDLPKGASREHVVFVDHKDRQAIIDCYHRYVAKTHGMMKRNKAYLSFPLRPETKIAAYRKGKRIEGYIIFNFKSSSDENWLETEIQMQELIYENREALSELMTFLNSQADQVHTIRYITQDEFFHFLPSDPRTDSGKLIPPVGHECNTQGVGLMYRIIDTPGLFRALKNHNFNGRNCKLKITVRDSFYPKNAGSYLIHFVDGRPKMKTGNEYDVEIVMDVADYSSMVMGVVPYDKLYEYGQAEISDPAYLDTVTKIFTADKKPICVTQF